VGCLTETARDRRVEICSEFAPRGSGRSRQRAHDQPSPGRELGKPVGAQMLELATQSIAHNRAADLTPDHEASSWSGVAAVTGLKTSFAEG
jgi:hypothetical protein